MIEKYIRLILRAVVYLLTGALVKILLERFGIPSATAELVGWAFAFIYMMKLFKTIDTQEDNASY